MPWSYSGKPWFLTIVAPLEEGIHSCTQAKEDLLEKLVIDSIELWIMFSAVLECLLRDKGPGPRLSIAQFHHPPVVQTSTLRLHEFQGCGILIGEFKLDLFAHKHP